MPRRRRGRDGRVALRGRSAVTLPLLLGGCVSWGSTMAPPAGQSVARLVVGVPLYALAVLPPSDTGADDGRGQGIRVVVGGGGGAARTGVANRIVRFFFLLAPKAGGVGVGRKVCFSLLAATDML